MSVVEVATDGMGNASDAMKRKETDDFIFNTEPGDQHITARSIDGLGKSQ